MSRVKSRAQTDVCGDCGASDPSWASINRGITLCAECCSVHRSLGRHISQVKSLRQGKLPPPLLNLVNALNAHGANSIWEHCLMDPKNSRRKPSPKDPLHPNKADFIRAKHVNLAFVLKPSSQEGDPSNPEVEVSKQLHASVRSPNLETSLRLLSQGADPNYYHEEKGSTPLHMAAKSGQQLQVELLLVYGADILFADAQNQTALDLAKANKHLAIVERLNEALYEVTDRLCYFLCSRRPDHTTSQHIIIPDQTGIEITEQLRIARGKLLLIPNKMFEELVMDLYDEVDRRETEAIWSTSALNPEIGAVPFLPANPHLSATRNQGRQKLARFSHAEFSGLLTDVLIDAKRRQNMATLRPINAVDRNHLASSLQRCSNMSDDEPLYDAVAEDDDDYAALAPVALQAVVNQSPINTRSNTEVVDTLKKQLLSANEVINALQSKIQKLAIENSELKSKIPLAAEEDEVLELRVNGSAEQNGTTSGSGTQQHLSVQEEAVTTVSANKRPVSMYEAREKQANKYGFSETRPTTASLYHMTRELTQEQSMPLNEEIQRHSNNVTRRIQELVKTMQDLTRPEAFLICADQIRDAIKELCAIFPAALHAEEGGPLKQLIANAAEMKIHCANLTESLTGKVDGAELTLKEVHQCAYKLARANKDLLTRFKVV